MAYPDFYNCNENRKFPFVQPDGNRLVYDVAFELPDNVILDTGVTISGEVTFDPATDYYELRSITWDAYSISFTFGFSNDTTVLEFVRYNSDYDAATSYAEGDDDPNKAIGYLVTDGLAALHEALTADIGVADTITPNYLVAIPKVEHSCIVSVGGSRVESVNIANLERYTVDPCCDEITPYDDTAAHEVASGLVGDIKFHEGYNIKINLSPVSNSLTIVPSQGSGDGTPCEEVKRWPSETKPAGSSVYSGGEACADLMFTVNGVSPANNGAFQLLGGSGIRVLGYADLHRIDIFNDVLNDIYCGDT